MSTDRRIPEASGLRQLFQEQWEHLQRLFAENVARHEAAQQGGEADQRAIDRLVNGTNPQVKAVFRYRQRLRDAVRDLLDHIGSLVDGLPAPVDACSKAALNEPCIRTLFGSRPAVADVLAGSPALNRYFDDPGHAGDAAACAVLFMRRCDVPVPDNGVVAQGALEGRPSPCRASTRPIPGPR